MTSPSRIARLVGVVLVAVAGWLLWPVTLGGATTYVVTHGVSMQPRFSTGDLAVLRRAGDYGVGDVVAYDSPSLHTVVMHRVVARDGDALTTKGDHNSWTDPDHPTTGQVLGSLALRVPQGGAALAQLRRPTTLVLLGLAAPALAWPLRTRRGRRPAHRPARSVRQAVPSFPTVSLPAPARAQVRQVAVGAAAVVLLAAAGEVVLLALPGTETGTASAVVAQQGRFDYSAPAQPSATYPSGQVRTGDAVYTRLAGPLTVTFRDTFSGAGLSGLTGSVRLRVTVAAGDGWRAELPAGAPAAPAGAAVTATAVVDPGQARELLGRHLAEVGATGSSATVTLTPVVAVTGSVEGHPFPAAGLPGLVLTMDTAALRPAATAALAPSTTTSVPVTRTAARSVAAGPLRLPLGTARGVVAAVLAAALLTVLAAGALGRGGNPDGEALLRSSARLLPVRRFTPGRQVVDVEDGAALLRLAERLDCLVLHAGDADGETFAVQDGETTYRWAAPARDGAAAPGVRLLTSAA